jgi:tryptophan-rich sensory protein
MEPREIGIAAIFVIICLAAGAIGSIFTFPSISGWYSALNKPWFSPPNWVFAPVWTLLYILMGISAYLVFAKGMENEGIRDALSMFAVQLVLNVLWSFLFFGLHSPLLGLICIIALWAAIAMTIMRFYLISTTAGHLLIPYILWVSFASILNLFVWILNPLF